MISNPSASGHDQAFNKWKNNKGAADQTSSKKIVVNSQSYTTAINKGGVNDEN